MSDDLTFKKGMKPSIKNQIAAEIRSLTPLDKLESETIKNVLNWLKSGVEVFRIKKPDTPPKHLVSYFVVVDGDYILLVDHINAELWLPTGGHVDVGEHPKTTVIREAQEELALDARFIQQQPIFLTKTKTVGKTVGHTDVSLWYAIKGSRAATMSFDNSEFHRIKWFHKDEIPFDRTDPELCRFLKKLYKT